MVSHTHRQRSGPSRTWLWLALVIVLVGGVAAVALALKKSPRSAAATCPHPVRHLRVVAAPDIEPLVASAAKRVVFGDCNPTRVTVSALDSARAAAAFATPKQRPDVWIPESSVRAASAGGTIATASIARTPAVLAVSRTAARSLGDASYARIAATATTARPMVLAVGDPSTSSTTLGVLVGLHQALATSATGSGNLAALLQNTVPLAQSALPAQPIVHNGSVVATPSTEQAVWSANRAANAYTAVYPPAPAPVLDHPAVVFGRGADHDERAVLAALAGRTWDAALRAHGFRPARGAAGFHAAGIDTAVVAATAAPSRREVDGVLRTMAVLRKPSRMLALIDVSGSMANTVPGSNGTTRIEVARTAAAEGIGLLPPDSAIGLWRFSADLTPGTDYQQLVAVAPLSDTTRGQLAAGVAQLRPVVNGGTGLYDSVFAAVESMRAHYDPNRVNSVVVLTDGKDESDPKHRVTLSTLVAALAAQRQSDRPVKVVTVAYGPDTDHGALRAIAQASGGIFYASVDPRDLPRIFRNAIGHRVCTTHC